MLQVLQVPGAVCRIWHENGHEDVLWWSQGKRGHLNRHHSLQEGRYMICEDQELMNLLAR
jgi:hypothetical protein